MNSPRMLSCGLAAALLTLGAVTAAQASPETLDLDTRFRAKLAKEKVKRSALESRFGAEGGNGIGAGVGNQGAACGNQNIGVIDNSGGKGGPPPREIFVFAPNAVNIVNSRGCN